MRFKRKIQKNSLYFLGFFILFFGVSFALPVHAGNLFEDGIAAILYAVFVAMGWLVSVAITLFSWAIDPSLISGPNGYFNLPATLNLWKFVRDFMNLFFILGLLFVALATVFGIDKYNYKKLLLKLVIAALLVNFSFPISRAIIDVANVPMYFFAESLLVDKSDPGSALGSVLGASQLEKILVPGGDYAAKGPTYMFMSVIFLFIFGITLLVLAVQLIIRVIALLILVILSPVGFVAGAVPGLQKYGQDWWKNFLKYAFFGPAVLFMLVLATNMMTGITGGGSYGGMRGVAQNSSAGDPGYIAALGMFAVPIILLWFTIGLSGKMAVMGAGTAGKYGAKAADWGRSALTKTGKGAYRFTGIPTAIKGAKQGVKKGAYEGKLLGFDYGKARIPFTNLGVGKLTTGKYWKESGENLEARAKGLVLDRGKGAKSELQKLENKRIYELAEENKKNNLSHAALISNIDPANGKDAITRKAAALTLANKDDIQNAQEFAKGLAALSGDAELTNQFVKKGAKSLQTVDDLTNAIDALGTDSKAVAQTLKDVNVGALNMTAAEYGTLISKQAFVTNPGLEKQLSGLMKKEGKVQTLVDHKVNTGATYDAAYMDLVADMRPEDLAKQGDSLHNNQNFINFVINNSQADQVFNDAHRKDVFGQLSGAKKAAWVNSGINP